MATFINTREAQKREIKEAILMILHDTTDRNPMTVTAITEELRGALAYTVTPQRVTALLRQMCGMCYFARKAGEKQTVRRARGGWYFIYCATE